MTFTPALAAAAFYAGLNTLIVLALTVATIRLRLQLRVVIGDGGHVALARAVRGHGNAAETIPLALLLLALVALAGAPLAAVHALGLALTVGRALHGWHFVQAGAPMMFRQVGIVLTMLVQALAALGLIGHALGAM